MEHEAERHRLAAVEAEPHADGHLRRLELFLELLTTWPAEARPAITPYREVRRKELVRQIAQTVLAEAVP